MYTHTKVVLGFCIKVPFGDLGATGAIFVENYPT